jgi:hypothetical protein
MCISSSSSSSSLLLFALILFGRSPLWVLLFFLGVVEGVKVDNKKTLFAIDGHYNKILVTNAIGCNPQNKSCY